MWQPIETAPKDGSFVMLHVPKGLESGAVTVGAYYNCRGERNEDGRFAKGWWDGWLGMDADIVSSWCEPTHWMPLPPPPAQVDTHAKRGDPLGAPSLMGSAVPTEGRDAP